MLHNNLTFSPHPIRDFQFSIFLVVDRSEQVSYFHECTAIFNMMGRIRRGAIASYITFIWCVEAAFSSTFALSAFNFNIAQMRSARRRFFHQTYLLQILFSDVITKQMFHTEDSNRVHISSLTSYTQLIPQSLFVVLFQ